MRVHHLDCGSHCPLGGAFFDGRSRGPFAEICTHCLLLELPDQLVLVDTGYGLGDLPGRRPRRLAHLWPLVLNPRLAEAATARRQIERLGFAATDVRHIVLTHLDFDHAGGIEDFPHAAVHVRAAEKTAAESVRRGLVGRQRYRWRQWDEVRDWRTYDGTGENWFGFAGARQLEGLPPDILMVPLRGHTIGHAGIAIRDRDRWLFDVGDAYLDRRQLDPRRPTMPPGLAIYERIMMTDPPAARANLARIKELLGTHQTEVEVFCSHDTAELHALARHAPQAAKWN